MAEIANLFLNIGSKFDDKGVKKAEQGVGFLKNAMSRIVVTAGDIVRGAQVMGRAIVGAATEAVNAYAKQQESERLLADAMRQKNVYTEEAFRHNLDLASSLQKVTTFGDEMILGVQRQLTNFGLQGEMLDEVTKATLDLAAATGMDLKAAGDLVAKSVGSSTNALSRYGITIEGSVGSTKRAQMAVENITALFGGSAAAAADTYAGKQKQLQNRWGDFLETVGELLIPFLLEVFEIINEDIIPLLGDFTKGVGKSDTAVENFGKMLRFIITVARGVIAIFNSLGDGITGLYLAFTGRFKAAGEAFKSMANKFVTFGESINEAEEARVERAKAREEEQTTKRQVEFEKREGIIKKETEAEKKAAEEKKKYEDALYEHRRAIGEISLEEHRVNLIKKLDEAERNTIEYIELQKQLYDTEKELADERNENITVGFAAALKEMEEDARNWKDTTIALFNGLTNNISAGFVALADGGLDNWQNFTDAMTSLARSMEDTLLKVIADIAAEWVTKHILMAAASKAWAAIEWGATLAVAAAKTVAGFIAANPIVGAVLGIAAAAAMVKAMNDQFKFFAKGGMVEGATAAIMGEGGAEVALPLNHPATTAALATAMGKASDAGGGMPGGGSYHFHIPPIPSPAYARQMADITAKEFFNKIKRNRRI